jgi:hypothetical protein
MTLISDVVTEVHTPVYCDLKVESILLMGMLLALDVAVCSTSSGDKVRISIVVGYGEERRGKGRYRS